jgi:hypothetical protein
MHTPTPASWYRANNASIVAAYLEHEPFAAAELPSSGFDERCADPGSVHARAPGATATRARTARAARPLVADPRRPTVGLFLDLRHSFPAVYPQTASLEEAIAIDQVLARAVDSG